MTVIWPFGSEENYRLAINQLLHYGSRRLVWNGKDVFIICFPKVSKSTQTRPSWLSSQMVYGRTGGGRRGLHNYGRRAAPRDSSREPIDPTRIVRALCWCLGVCISQTNVNTYRCRAKCKDVWCLVASCAWKPTCGGQVTCAAPNLTLLCHISATLPNRNPYNKNGK